MMSEQGLWCQTHLGLGPDPAAAQLRELGPPVSSSAEGGAPGPWEGSSRGPSPVSGPCGRPGRTKLGRASWVRRQLWPRACAAGNIVWEPGKHGASLHRLSPDLLCRALRSWGHGVALFASRWPQHGTLLDAALFHRGAPGALPWSALTLKFRTQVVRRGPWRRPLSSLGPSPLSSACLWGSPRGRAACVAAACSLTRPPPEAGRLPGVRGPGPGRTHRGVCKLVQGGGQPRRAEWFSGRQVSGRGTIYLLPRV